MVEELFVKQKKIYPQVLFEGHYRTIKWLVMLVLLGIYYGTPWIRWHRGEFLPDQAVLIDMPNRRGYFFFIEIWPEEVYYLAGILMLAAMGLFLVTSLFGRMWCGYACPQTVWVDLFLFVERFIQGDRNQQIKLDKAAWSLEKLAKKTTTHLIWLLISLCTGGAWVFYFNDAPSLLQEIINFNVPWDIGIWIIILTASTYIMAGFAREQVCIYMCPYARFQSAMFDKHTLIVGYDAKRGETRRKLNKQEGFADRGHCIDCKQCVVVCPQGIDIRDGLQLECIACGLCMDACNKVMKKLGLPPGLIRYGNESSVTKWDNKFSFKSIVRLRTLYYVVLMLIVAGIMLYTLINRSPLDISVLHDRSPLFVRLSNGDIRNSYTVKILNKSHQDKKYVLNIEGLPGAEVKIQGSNGQLEVLADNLNTFRVFVVAAPKNLKKNTVAITFIVKEEDTNLTDSYNTMFVTTKE